MSDPETFEEELDQSQSDSLQPVPEGRSSAGEVPLGHQPASVLSQEEPEGEATDEKLRQELIQELDQLVKRLKALVPSYVPPPFSPRGLVDLLDRNLGRFSPRVGLAFLGRLRSTIREDLFDVDTWKGIWYVVNYSLQDQGDILRRRLSGEYETDDWGFDPEFLQAVAPFLNFMYKTYWRVQTLGMENIPLEGRGLLVCNHSGRLAWDASMLATAIYNEHPNQRLVRTLYSSRFLTLPFFSTVLVKLGQVVANQENGLRLLEQEELVSVFPEGRRGVAKAFRDRYRLARFGQGGFVRMAIKTFSPIIPVSIVGAEDAYISLAYAPGIAKPIGFPIFPITITWPWFGLLGLIPFPSRWYVDFGAPIPTDVYAPGADDDLVLVSQLTDEIRNIVQRMILARLAKRQSVVLG